MNVLRGEMSLVGPRPLPLRDYRQLEDWHRRRYNVLPGITGLWQISGRSNLSFDDLVRLDFYYLENWSIWLDIGIIVKTHPGRADAPRRVLAELRVSGSAFGWTRHFTPRRGRRRRHVSSAVDGRRCLTPGCGFQAACSRRADVGAGWIRGSPSGRSALRCRGRRRDPERSSRADVRRRRESLPARASLLARG